MKFSEMPYSRPDLEAMKANLTACTEAFLAAESAQEQIAQYDRVTDLSVEFNTMGSLANARHTIDTRDEFYDAESTFFDESWPQLSVYFQRLNEAMLDSKFRPELEAHYGSLLFLKLEISRRSFKPELVELMQEENRLTSRYQKLYANMTVEFDGKPIPLNNPRKCLDAQLAFVSEDRRGVGLLLDETLEWNVAFPAMQIQNKFLKKYGPITWRDTKAIHDVTQKYIDELKIKCTSSKQKARELSGGNQQKVCLAKAFALQPRFLFVSEPTRGIDVGAKALVLDALKKFNRENGVTVVMISSELEELRTTCDRIAIVSGGRIVGILPATESSETFGALMVSQVK